MERAGDDYRRALLWLAEALDRGRLIPVVGRALDKDYLPYAATAPDLVKDHLEAKYLEQVLDEEAPRRSGTGDLAELLDLLFVIDPRRIREDYFGFIKGYLRQVHQSGLISKQTALASSDARRRSRKLSVTDWALELGIGGHGEFNSTVTYRALASLDLPIYITTSYHHFLEHAITERRGEPPRSITLRKNPDDQYANRSFELSPEPSSQAPVVLHLLGSEEEMESLVMSGTDFSRQAVVVARDLDLVIPAQILHFLSDSTILLLGFEFKSREYDSFMGLVESVSGRKGRNHIAQIEPSSYPNSFVENVLREYHFDGVWGTTEELLFDLGSAYKEYLDEADDW